MFTLLLPISLFLSSVLIMFEAQKYIDTKIPKDFPVLYDHAHIYMPDLSKYYQIGDLFIGLYVGILIFFYNERLDIFLYILTILYLFRTFSFTVTLLPKCGTMPDKDMTRSSKQILMDYILFKDTHFGARIDMLPSGHCTVLTLIVLHISKYNDPHHYVKIGFWILNCMLYTLTVISKCHYTIDVVFAYITTVFVYQNMVGYLE